MSRRASPYPTVAAAPRVPLSEARGGGRIRPPTALCAPQVIPRKDLPRIYTMCVPTRNNADASNAPVLSSAMADLESTRKEVCLYLQRTSA